MTEPFTDAERRALERLADALIPAAPGALSASAAGIGGALLDRVAEHVPQRLALLREIVAMEASAGPADALARLHRGDPARYDLFCETIAAAYFMSDAVRAQIAYPGRVAVPARIDVTDIEELLLPVLDGGFAPRAVGGAPP